MMTRPGILYWFRRGNKEIEMLVKTEKIFLGMEEEKESFEERTRCYKHTLLDNRGKLVTPRTETEKLEDDKYWGKFYERIDL